MQADDLYKEIENTKTTVCLLIELCVDNTSFKPPRGIKINCLNLTKNPWKSLQLNPIPGQNSLTDSHTIRALSKNHIGFSRLWGPTIL